MTDQRRVAWTHLVPKMARYQTIGVPEKTASLLEARRGPASVLVSWRQSSWTLPDLQFFDGFVAVNGDVPSRATLHDQGFTHLRRYAVVPGMDDPRWYIPLDHPAVAAAAFQLYTPYRSVARLKRNVAQVAARLSLPGWYHDQIVIGQRTPPPVEQLLTGIFPCEAICLALSTGTTGPARKVTAAILNRRGGTLAFAKFAESPASDHLVRNEAATLAHLAILSPTTLLAPRLLYAGVIDGSFTALQQTVSGGQAPRTMTPAHQQFLEALMVGRAKPATKTAFVSTLRSRLDELSPADGDLIAVLDSVWTVLEELELPSTIVHGDFAPWNLRLDGGKLVAIDWEYGVVDGLPFLDEIHHFLQVGILIEGWSAAVAFDRLKQQAMSSPRGLTTEQVRAIQTVYLLDKLARRYEEGHPHDEEIVLLYRQMLEHLSMERGVQVR